MVRKADYTVNSENAPGEKQFQLASGYISETTILFEKENVVAVIQAKGSVEFFNMQDERLAVLEAPAVVNGKEVYEDIRCMVEDHTIILKFPLYQWIDNYPHCDGEHDRWDTRIVGFHRMSFDLSSLSGSVQS